MKSKKQNNYEFISYNQVVKQEQINVSKQAIIKKIMPEIPQFQSTQIESSVYTIDSFGSGSAFDACSYGSPSVTVYASPGYTVPMVGMIFYDSSSLTTPYIGGSGWRKFTNGVTNYAGEVDIYGELTNYSTC